MRLQKGHMDNIHRMAGVGALVGAGPTSDPKLRGLFVFRGVDLNKARELASADPLIQDGDLRMDLMEWDGPAGIGDRYKEPAKMLRYQLALVRRGADSASSLAKLPKVIAYGPVRSGEYSAMFVMDAGSLEAATAAVNGAKTPGVDVQMLTWLVADGVLPESGNDPK